MRTAEGELWFEVYKPTVPKLVSEEISYIPPSRIGPELGYFFREEFDGASQPLPDEGVYIFALYLAHPWTEEFDLEQWLERGVLDVSEYCDGILTVTHFAEQPKFAYYPLTDRGNQCEMLLEEVFVGIGTKGGRN